jgi:hypothetical protein
MSSHAQTRLAPVIRPATEADLLPIARVFLGGLDTSLPHRKLANDFYVWERDAVSPDGRLRRRLERELARDHVVVALIGEEGRVGGYVNWSSPRTIDGKYKPGEVRAVLCLLICSFITGLSLPDQLSVRRPHSARPRPRLGTPFPCPLRSTGCICNYHACHRSRHGCTLLLCERGRHACIPGTRFRHEERGGRSRYEREHVLLGAIREQMTLAQSFICTVFDRVRIQLCKAQNSVLRSKLRILS